MRKIDEFFLICVLGCATLFAARSMGISFPLLLTERASLSRTSGSAAGQPRTVDMPKLQLLLEQGVLSDREAEYYEPVEQ